MRAPLRPVGNDEAGLSTIEAIFTIPVVMLMIFGILQTGLWWYARQVALTAAQEGARAARTYDGTDTGAAAKASTYLSQVQGRDGAVLVNPDVTVVRGSSTATVRVRGHLVSVLPGLSITIDATSTGPVEAFSPPS